MFEIVLLFLPFIPYAPPVNGVDATLVGVGVLGSDLCFPPYVLRCFAFSLISNILTNFMQNFRHVAHGVNTMQICGLCWGSDHTLPPNSLVSFPK